MRTAQRRLRSTTLQAIRRIFDALDYTTLGPIYCDEGGDEFWKAKRGPCQRLGIRLVEALMPRLKAAGASLYVGAGVAEIPMLAMETMELGRDVQAYNLRREEVRALNRACRALPVKFQAGDATKSGGRFDHVWIVSVLNDPELFPHLSALSYGRANPATFNPRRFIVERQIVRRLADRCLKKLTLPGLVTTSTEEVIWIADWCHRHKVPYRVDEKSYPTAVVEDPVCFVRVGRSQD
jgi:hypothetical protein